MRLKNLAVHSLTEYQRRRLNSARTCTVCGAIIHDYDLISMETRRDRRRVEYAFTHSECAKHVTSLFEGRYYNGEYIQPLQICN